MIPPDSSYQIYWEKTGQSSAKILRIYGDSPAVTVPAYLAGYPVTELGNYCFAPSCRLPAKTYLIQDTVPSSGNASAYAGAVRELCGSYIERVTLPDSLIKIGNYAFFNCRNLTQLEFGPGLTVIGSDAFMNCSLLHHLTIRCGPSDKTGLRQVLSQISWETEVSFAEHAQFHNMNDTIITSAILYPEYYETYDEIAPAHVFGRNITGEGFRARQCFKNNVIDYSQYDTIFQKACAEESEQTLCRLAHCRLRYPIELSIERKAQYEAYIRIHGKALCQSLIAAKDLDALSDVFQQHLLSLDDIQYAVLLASQAGWTEGCASMLRWKQQNTAALARKKYTFDNFS